MKGKVLLFLLFICFYIFNDVFGVELTNDNFLYLNDVKKGQKGFGLTRWDNNELKKFEIEVLGVLKTNPKSGVIIAKINDEEINKTGVVAGMSGSPVYIDNKLVGAVAFTWSFLKEPLVGITPIEDMIPLERYVNNNLGLSTDIKYTTPILLSGVSTLTRKFLESKLSTQNVVFIDSFSSFRIRYDDVETSKLKPGDGIGINLVTGDMELTAIGTVTYVEGNKIFGLGHPAFLSGKTSIPISDVDVITIVPKQDLSFKIGVPKNVIGTMEFDGSSGLFGVIGKKPQMIKVSINVDNQNLYNYSIAKDNSLLPLLISSVLTESVLRTKGLSGEGNVEIKCSVLFKFQGVDKEFSLDFKDIIPVYQMNYGYALSISDVNSILDFLMYNPLFKVDISRMHIDINTKPLDVGFIAFVIPSKSVVHPGDEISIKVGIKKLWDDILIKEFKVRIPTWVPKETKITIGAMNKAIRTIQKINQYPETIVFDTYEKLYDFISEDLRVDKLVLYLELPSSSYASGGYVYNILPNYLSTVFSTTPKPKNIIPFVIEEESLENSPIGGFLSTSIFVK